MFNRINIFTYKKNECKKLNFLTEIFSNKYEIAIITFLIYFLGVLYQIIKLIGYNTPNIGNLMFFSFYSSINDFLILFGYSLFMFLYLYLTLILPNLLFLKNNNSNIRIIIGVILNYVYVFILFFISDVNYNKNKYIFIFLVILYSIGIIFVIYKSMIGKLNKKVIYTFLLVMILYSFIILQISGVSYYGCENLKCNTEKNCVLLKYKNDKYGFTLDGDIYKIDEFKSFYTGEYFKNNKHSGEECNNDN